MRPDQCRIYPLFVEAAGKAKKQLIYRVDAEHVECRYYGIKREIRTPPILRIGTCLRSEWMPQGCRFRVDNDLDVEAPATSIMELEGHDLVAVE